MFGIKGVSVPSAVAPEGTDIRRFDDDASAMQALLSGQVDALGCATTIAQQIDKRTKGEYENKLNALLGTPAGTAYVAWVAADNIKFADTLTFSSAEGIPAVLRLRQFAVQFMGR